MNFRKHICECMFKYNSETHAEILTKLGTRITYNMGRGKAH